MGLGRAGVAADQRCAPRLMRPQHRHLTGVRIGCPRLSQGVVGVGPDHDQAQLAQRREHRAAGANHQPRAAPQRGQPAPIACLRAQAGRQCYHTVLIDEGRRGLPQGVQIPLIGHDRQYRAPGTYGLRGSLGESVRPQLAR
ncbi:Uncharacterised protein [Mycobacterium tuberculosis]|nr:Uncharacterised protein [Mycobacterium tuberculosis]